jgi:hypothetical protein
MRNVQTEELKDTHPCTLGILNQYQDLYGFTDDYSSHWQAIFSNFYHGIAPNES